MVDILLGIGLSGLIAVAAVAKKKLTFYAGLTAVAVGALVFVWAGWVAWAVMIAFFASTSVTGRFSKQLNPTSGPRKVTQVLANGLPAVLFAFVFHITNSPLFLLAPVAAIACATADTWSSDIGVVSRQKPVSILTFKRITPGQSGGVSLLGSMASVLGAAFIAGVFLVLVYFFYENDVMPFLAFYIITVCGALGSLVDSVLGAGIQAKYRYNDIIVEETKSHMQNAALVSGFKGVNNNVVNFLSGLAAGGIAVGLSWVFVV